tara:strand:- start:9224 stop:9403 length:180 start_codon:yes stop_codon:yes gene_type:complete
MTPDEIRDIAILVTEHLLDYAPDLLSKSVAEVRGEYTQETFDLQDTITEALTEILSKKA